MFGSAANNPEQKTRLQREIEATDREGAERGRESFIGGQHETNATERRIDQVVHQLYSLAQDEVKIAEEIVA